MLHNLLGIQKDLRKYVYFTFCFFYSVPLKDARSNVFRFVSFKSTLWKIWIQHYLEQKAGDTVPLSKDDLGPTNGGGGERGIRDHDVLHVGCWRQVQNMPACV